MRARGAPAHGPGRPEEERSEKGGARGRREARRNDHVNERLRTFRPRVTGIEYAKIYQQNMQK